VQFQYYPAAAVEVVAAADQPDLAWGQVVEVLGQVAEMEQALAVVPIGHLLMVVAVL